MIDRGLMRPILGLCGLPWALMGWALVGPPVLLWAGPLRTPMGPCGPGACGHPWDLVGEALVSPLGPYRPSPCGHPGPLWAEPLWASLGLIGPAWAFMGRALSGRALLGRALMGHYRPDPFRPGRHGPLRAWPFWAGPHGSPGPIVLNLHPRPLVQSNQYLIFIYTCTDTYMGGGWRGPLNRSKRFSGRPFVHLVTSPLLM